MILPGVVLVPLIVALWAGAGLMFWLVTHSKEDR